MTIPQVVDGVTDADAAFMNQLVDAANQANAAFNGAGQITTAAITPALGAYTGPWRGPHDCREWGIEADGNDHASDFATMVSELASETNRQVQLRSGDIPVDSTIGITTRGVTLIGSRGDRPETYGGSRLIYSGTGPCIQLGVDNGHPWDQHDYDGVQDFTLKDVSLKYVGSSTTPLLNGRGSYGTGTSGVADWRGGNVKLDCVTIENFEQGFFGVNSDLNLWTEPMFRYCAVGAYIGPKSDQLVILHPYSLFNDTLFHFDAAWHATIIGMATVGDGSATTPAIKIGSDGWGIGSGNITFLAPWFEHTIVENVLWPSFVDVGIGDAIASKQITLSNPMVILDDSPNSVSAKRTTALLRVDNGDQIVIDNPSGSVRQLRALVQNVGAHDPRIKITGGVPDQNMIVENTSTGVAAVQVDQWGMAESATPSIALSATIATSETLVPHGLPYTPTILGIVPKADARVWESTPPDDEYLYLTASASAVTDITLGTGTPQPAFGAVFLSDTFTDTDSTALGSHTPDVGTWVGSVGHSALTIQSNRIAASADFQRPMVDTGSTDHRVALTFNLGDDGSSRQAGAIVRSVDASNYWIVAPARNDVSDINRLEVLHVVATVPTTVHRAYLSPMDANTDYRLVAEVRGDVLRVTLDGFPVLTYEGMNAVHPTGECAGFAIFYRGSGTATVRVDDLEIRKP